MFTKWKTTINEKKESINSNLSEKFPKMSSKTSSVYNYIKDVWDETFPNEDNKVR